MYLIKNPTKKNIARHLNEEGGKLSQECKNYRSGPLCDEGLGNGLFDKIKSIIFKNFTPKNMKLSRYYQYAVKARKILYKES